MKNVLSKLWSLVDGNKTLIGALVLLGPELLDVMVKIVTESGGDPLPLQKAFGLALMVVGALHKMMKAATPKDETPAQ